MATWILPGRHQPPHNDHLALIREALRVAPGPVVLGLVVQRTPRGRARSRFERRARRENAPARCPFGFLQRWTLIHAALSTLPGPLRARVIVLPVPRPEAEWPLVTALFPGRRVWLVSDVGDAFDDAKARFFRARGDAVRRLRVTKTTDGRTVRACLRRPAELARHVPPPVAALLSQWQWLHRSRKGARP